MFKVLFLLSVVYLFANAQTGFIDGGNTTIPNAGAFNISWATCNNNGVAVIYITMASQYPGWMGLQPKKLGGPIGGNVGHINTDIIWMWIDLQGYVHVYDLWSPFLGYPTSTPGVNCTTYGSCTDIDTAFPGGTEDTVCVAGTRNAAGFTSITFKRNFIATDPYDVSFDGNDSVWALGKDVIPASYKDISNQAFMHCKDCLKAIYNATCGAAIFTGFRASCGYNTTSIGYVARNQHMPVVWWNGTDPNTLPACNSDPVAFPTTTCAVAPATSAATSAAAPTSAAVVASTTKGNAGSAITACISFVLMVLLAVLLQ